jgi:hypothetical protein
MPSRPRRSWTCAWIMAAVLPALVVLACDNGTGPEDLALVQIEITDSPLDILASAEVWISRVYLQGGLENDSSATFDLFNDPEDPKHYDLLTLQDSLTAELTDPVAVEEGVYPKLRLVVDSALVTLKEGFAFEDGDTAKVLKVPGGSTSRIQVHLAEPINVEKDQTTIVLVDFDVEKNFVFQGGGKDGTYKKVTFIPTLTEKGRHREKNSS